MDERLAFAALRGGVLRLAVDLAPALEAFVQLELEGSMRQGLILERSEHAVERVLAGGDDFLVVLLKGSASAHTCYEHPWHRERRDVDLLVLPEHFPRVQTALEGAGWTSPSPANLPWWGRRLDVRHEVTLVGPQGVEVDLHRRLTLYQHLPVDEQGIVERSTPGQGVLRFPSPVDLVLHTALHAAVGGFRVPLKSWVDLLRLTQQPGFDWEVLGHRARDWRVDTCLWAAFDVMQRFFHTDVPDGFLTGIRPGRAAERALTKILAHDGETPVAPTRFTEAWRQVARQLTLGGRRPWEWAIEHARLRMAQKTP